MSLSKERPQKVLSRKLLRDALLTLMNQEPYRVITICELCEQAGVSRKTFYRHYRNIDEILYQILDEFATQTVDMIHQEVVKRILNFTKSYFEFMTNHLELLCLLDKNGLLPELLQCIREKTLNIFPANPEDQPDIFSDWSFSVAFGMIWSLMLCWLKEGATRSPEEMEKIMQDVIVGMIQGYEFSIHDLTNLQSDPSKMF